MSVVCKRTCPRAYICIYIYVCMYICTLVAATADDAYQTERNSDSFAGR